MLNELKLLVKLHIDGERQGPGGIAETKRTIELSGLYAGTQMDIADYRLRNRFI